MNQANRALKVLMGASLLGLIACGPPSSIPAKTVLKNLDSHLGQRLVIKTKLKSGARCKIVTEGGWKTYCGNDCQYCKGPMVIDSGVDLKEEGLNDWPMILGGTWKGKDIRCKGPLNKIECYPFELGKTYVIQGRVEKHHPPKLLVRKFWAVD